MANAWLRLWHDMPNDPKWRTIARISGQPVSLVQATYIHILVSASESPERGCFTIEAEDIASSLNESDESVNAVITAMQGRVIEGRAILGWSRRQLQGDDYASPQQATGSHYIYFVGATVATRSSVVTTETTVVKVAISSNPWARLRDMKKDKKSNFELLAKLKISVRSSDEILQFFSHLQNSGGWIKNNYAINSLIERINSKEIINYEQCVSYLSELPPDSFVEIRSYDGSEAVATVATKDTDTDTDIKPERESNAHEQPVDNFPGDPPDDDPPEKFRMHADWQPPPGFTNRAAGWGRKLDTEPGYTAAQLCQFRDFWLAEGASKAQLQWEMAFADSLEHQKAGGRERRRKTSALPEPGPVSNRIPKGFRGYQPDETET